MEMRLGRDTGPERAPGFSGIRPQPSRSQGVERSYWEHRQGLFLSHGQTVPGQCRPGACRRTELETMMPLHVHGLAAPGTSACGG